MRIRGLLNSLPVSFERGPPAGPEGLTGPAGGAINKPSQSIPCVPVSLSIFANQVVCDTKVTPLLLFGWRRKGALHHLIDNWMPFIQDE
jgi:hypothetical protein